MLSTKTDIPQLLQSYIIAEEEVNRKLVIVDRAQKDLQLVKSNLQDKEVIPVVSLNEIIAARSKVDDAIKNRQQAVSKLESLHQQMIDVLQILDGKKLIVKLKTAPQGSINLQMEKNFTFWLEDGKVQYDFH